MSKVNQLKNKARREEQRENWSRAIELYTQALDASRKEGEAFADLSLYNRIGDIYLRIGQKNTAVRYYEQAIERYADQDLHTSAIALCNKVLRIHPQRSTVFLQLGRLNLATNLIADARAHFHKYAEAMRERGTDDAAFEALEELIEETGDPRTLELWISWLAAMSDQEAAIARVEEQRNSLIAHGIGPDQVIEQVRTGETGDIERDPVAAKQHDPLADAFLSLPDAAPAAAREPSAEETRANASTDDPGMDGGDASAPDEESATPAMPHPVLGDDLPYPVGATDLPAPEGPPEPLPLLDEPAEDADLADPAPDLEPAMADAEEPVTAEAEEAVTAGPDESESFVGPSAAAQARIPEPAPMELGSMQWDDEAEELLAELNRPLEAAWSEYANETFDPSPPLRSAPEPETEPEREEFPAAAGFVPAAPDALEIGVDEGSAAAAASPPAEPDAPETGADEESPSVAGAGPAEPDAPETGSPEVALASDAWALAPEGLDIESDGPAAPASAGRAEELEPDEPDADSPIEASADSAAAPSEDVENWDRLESSFVERPPSFEDAESDAGLDADVGGSIDDLPAFAEEPPVLEADVPEPEAAEPAEEDAPHDVEPVFDVGAIEEPDEAGEFRVVGDPEAPDGVKDSAGAIPGFAEAPEDAEEPEREDDSWAADAREAIEAIEPTEPEPAVEPEAEPVAEAGFDPEVGSEDEVGSDTEAASEDEVEAEEQIEVAPTPAPDPIGEMELAPLEDGSADGSADDEASLIEALEIETLTVEASTRPAAPPVDGARPVSPEDAGGEPIDEMAGSFAESRLTIEEDPEDAFRDWVQSATVGVLKRALPELENRSETEKALLVIERLSQLEDTDVEFRTRLIDNLEKLGRVEPAANACLTLGTALQLMGRTAEARKAYQRALRIRPGHEAARAALEQLGDAAEDDGMEEAIPVVPTPYTPEHATPNDSPAILDAPIRSPIMPPNGNGEGDLRPYSGVAGGAEASDDFEQLLSEFRAELHQKPGTSGSSSHTELGASLKEMGRLDDAIRELQAAVREPSAPPLAYELLGEAFLEKGQGRIAIRLLEKALGTLGHGDRELMGVLYQLGRAYESTAEQSKALVCYERIFSVDIDYRDIQERILTCSA